MLLFASQSIPVLVAPVSLPVVAPLLAPLLLGLLPLVVAILCGVAYRQQADPALRLLCLGALATVTGLVVSMLPIASPWLVELRIPVGMSIGMLAGSLILQATARIFGRRVSPPWLALPPLLWLCLWAVPAIRDIPAHRLLAALAIAAGLTASCLWQLLRSPRETASHRGLVALALVHLLSMALYALWWARPGLLPGIDAVSWVLPAEIVTCMVLWPGLSVLLVAELAIIRERSRALHDDLSGALNRRGFWGAAETIEHRSILLFDIDHFKQINDTFGHAAGDLVITRFSRLASDILGAGTIFGRIGGEEFAAALDNVTVAQARRWAEEVRIAFAALVPPDGTKATVSVGLSMASGIRQSLGDQMALADRTLYRAKRLGRNRTVLQIGESSDVAPGSELAGTRTLNTGWSA